MEERKKQLKQEGLSFAAKNINNKKNLSGQNGMENPTSPIKKTSKHLEENIK